MFFLVGVKDLFHFSLKILYKIWKKENGKSVSKNNTESVLFILFIKINPLKLGDFVPSFILQKHGESFA